MTGQVILGSKPKVNFVIGWYIFFTTRTVFPISIQWGFSFVKPRGLISNQPLLLKRTQSPVVALTWFRIKKTMNGDCQILSRKYEVFRKISQSRM